MPGHEAENFSMTTKPARSGASIETSGDSLLVRLPDWMTPEQVAELKAKTDAWLQEQVSRAGGSR